MAPGASASRGAHGCSHSLVDGTSCIKRDAIDAGDRLWRDETAAHVSRDGYRCTLEWITVSATAVAY